MKKIWFCIILISIGLLFASYQFRIIEDKIEGVKSELYDNNKDIEEYRKRSREEYVNLSGVVLEKEINKAKDILKARLPDLYYDSIVFDGVRYNDNGEYIIDLYISGSMESKYGGNTYCVSKNGIISRF